MKDRLYILGLLFLFVFGLGTNLKYYDDTGNYFGKEDILNYQHILDNTDSLHIGVWVLGRLFGKTEFFLYVMPFIIFICLPYVYYRLCPKFEFVFFAQISTGLIGYYWIVGLYSQAISHILLMMGFGLWHKPAGKIFILYAILNHSYEIIPFIIFYYFRGKHIRYLVISVLITGYFYLENIVVYTVFSHPGGWDYISAFLILINPFVLGAYLMIVATQLNSPEKKKDHLIYMTGFFGGLLTRNFRLSMYFLPYMALSVYWELKDSKIRFFYIISSVIYSLWIFTFHVENMIFEQKLIGMDWRPAYNSFQSVLPKDVCSDIISP